MLKVTAKEDEGFTRAYPKHMPARMTVHMNDGKTVTEEVQDFSGMPVRPLTWKQALHKYESLTQHRIENSLADEIIEAVKAVETTSARDLLSLLNKVPTPKNAATG